MEGDPNQSYLDLLNFSGSEQLSENPVGEQQTPPTQEPSASVKGKWIKGKNWSTLEDTVLIQAWANTSLDAVVGTDQQGHSYWGRISDYYNMHKKPHWPERNANGLNCRYTTISAQTAKFSGCLQQIINRNQSGMTIEQKV